MDRFFPDFSLGEFLLEVLVVVKLFKSLIKIQALRLAIHIGIRHKVEDFRYQDMRRDWNEKGGRWGYLWRTFVFIFSMQESTQENNCHI